jgi:hypothetical protein
MLQLKNRTPFQSALLLLPDEKGVETLYVLLKATFETGPPVRVASRQEVILDADEFWDEPETSSLKCASDVHLVKPSTDVVLVGDAQAPDRERVTCLDVSVAVADHRKIVRVFGERTWTGNVIPPFLTSPVPFETMALVYERAFGGRQEPADQSSKALFDPHNPVGCGFSGKRGRKEMKGLQVPNLEDPRNLLKEPGDTAKPACFAYVAPSWEPRKSYAGTYGDAWLKSRAPYLPEDFDRRFFNMASPDLVCSGYLRGGEAVEVRNASPDGLWKFEIPTLLLRAGVRIAGTCVEPPLVLETLLLQPGMRRFVMTWRAALCCDKVALKIESVDINLFSISGIRAAA